MTMQIKVGKVPVGGGAPVSIQSMTNTLTSDVESTLKQIHRLAERGCDIVRCAVPDMAAAEALSEISAASPIPVIADIHFDYRLALAAIQSSVAGIRLNPGNIQDPEKIKLVAEKAGEKNIPIRVGSNSGSVAPQVLAKLQEKGLRGSALMATALVESALEQVKLLEQYHFHQIKISVKSASVPVTLAACQLLAQRTLYPQHIGITEAGTPARGIVKSAVGIGYLLLNGIGDTLRVSLTAQPEEEIAPALRILEACGLREAAPEVVSCPTCGRTRINLIALVEKVEELLAQLKSANLILPWKKIAVMGCVVNGPGEARDAELGIAGGNGKLAIFRHGELLTTLPEAEGWEYFAGELRKAAVHK